MTRVIISWNPARTKPWLIFFFSPLHQSRILFFSSNPCCQKCLDLSSSSSYSSSLHHLLLFLLLHHPLTLLSSGRLVRLISPPMDSLLLPHCELRLFAARLCGRQTCRSWAVGWIADFFSFFLFLKTLFVESGLSAFVPILLQCKARSNVLFYGPQSFVEAPNCWWVRWSMRWFSVRCHLRSILRRLWTVMNGWLNSKNFEVSYDLYLSAEIFIYKHTHKLNGEKQHFTACTSASRHSASHHPRHKQR